MYPNYYDESEDPTLERTYRGHHGTITDVSFCPSMKRMASVAMDSTLFVWNFKPNLRSYKYLKHEKGGVMCVEFAPLTGKLIATGGKDKQIRLWQPTIEGKSTVIKGHTNTVRSLKFTTDSKRILSCSDDKTIKVSFS
jgi:centriolar protein POC1